jgi:hypothetical protein
VQCRACKCANVVLMEGMRAWLAMGKGGGGGLSIGFVDGRWKGLDVLDSWYSRLGMLGMLGSLPHAF